jgi:hypothetical protein
LQSRRRVAVVYVKMVHYTLDFVQSLVLGPLERSSMTEMAFSNGPNCVGAFQTIHLSTETDTFSQVLCSFRITDC